MQALGSQKPTSNLALNVYFAYRTYLMEVEVGPMIVMGTQKIVEWNYWAFRQEEKCSWCDKNDSWKLMKCTKYNFHIHFLQLGPNSGLHIIIFDEIDAICKARGSTGSNTGVHDTVVNQLLAKIDGVEQLNNILVIGMTNRRDMIDEALMRPGRLEVWDQAFLIFIKIHTYSL